MSHADTLSFDTPAGWIWSRGATRPFNNYVCFRREFDVQGVVASATLWITADARYECFINGRWLGHGPARSWPEPWPVDRYDLRGWLRPGRNVVAVLVHHFGISNLQYIHADPGLLAQIDWHDEAGSRRIVSDTSWRCRPHEGFAWPAPRITRQMGWEEQFDARMAPFAAEIWTSPDFSDRDWAAADLLRPAGAPPHEKLVARPIPFLAREAVQPAHVLRCEVVQPAAVTLSLEPAVCLNATDRSANMLMGRLLFMTHIFSACKQEAIFQQLPLRARWRLNGEDLKFDDCTRFPSDYPVACATLKRGWNLLVARPPVITNVWSTTLNIHANRPLRCAAVPSEPAVTAHWLVAGPFAGEDAHDFAFRHQKFRDRVYVEAERFAPGADEDAYEELWNKPMLEASDLTEPYIRPAAADQEPAVDVLGVCGSERAIGGAVCRIEEPQALCFDNADWTVVHPPRQGDARLLLDFGRELVGFLEFEMDAPAGTVVDFFLFEFIQRDGRINLAETLHNTFRYTCRDGMQRYRTFLRRGFRYAWMSLRALKRPVRIRQVRAWNNIYPAPRQGRFACSDPLLNQIWQASVETLRCCAEDTYTDCPVYEQSHWVGDACVEAMADLTVHGDPRLSAHCWLQAAQSLQRSSLVESHVPSGWVNVLPAWSFLWMRWALEHFMMTGDRPLGRKMLGWLEQNIRGIEQHLNAKGLFEIEAWNMFDWSPMDTPGRGVVTHQNCLAVMGLRDAAHLAEWLGCDANAGKWRELADRLTRAINRHLWSNERGLYVDSLHEDGTVSTVFSQQTQTAALIGQVASGARAVRCLDALLAPETDLVRAGSPFFMAFLLEALARARRYDELIDTVRQYWGVQLAEGATTFWEMFHPHASRKTRSHCHGWSAAPAYVLIRHVMGIMPLEPGYKRILVAPQPGNLTWVQGTVPTPRGLIDCQWRCAGASFHILLSLPREVSARMLLPATGRVEMIQGQITGQGKQDGGTILETLGQVVEIAIGRDKRHRCKKS